MKKITIHQLILFLILTVVLVLAACAETPAPAPPPPTPTPAFAPEVHIPNLENGHTSWNEARCGECHGPVALGGIGPQLASTELPFDEFLHVVRTALPPKPAYNETQLSNDAVYDIYAWVRTQIPQSQFPTAGSGPGLSSTETPSVEEVRGMTIWTCRGCDGCHGVFAQGGPEAPPLAGLNYPVEEELARMRSVSADIPEHTADHISDEVFTRLYEWIKAGCVQDECYH